MFYNAMFDCLLKKKKNIKKFFKEENTVKENLKS